jgi:hypothetical protein
MAPRVAPRVAPRERRRADQARDALIPRQGLRRPTMRIDPPTFS